MSGARSFLLYGSYGYTGRLIAALAVERGFEPVLAGRDPRALEKQAERLGLSHATVSIDDGPGLRRVLADRPLVLHCAGPFSRTFRPMVEACLGTGAHYLDITGEISVFEEAAAEDERARAAEVMILPGVGFDVVPTDCLAVYLRSRLSSATRLVLAILSPGGVSRGTALTMAESLGRGGMIRRGGKLTAVPAGWNSRLFDFGIGEYSAVTIPWGDVSTAYYSTGIGDIEVYAAAPPRVQRAVRATQRFGRLLASKPVQRLIERAIRGRVSGPSAGERARAKTWIFGEATDDSGARAAALQTGPEGYSFTALTAMQIVARVLDGDAPPGFQTPGRAYGHELVLDIPGVERSDVD